MLFWSLPTAIWYTPIKFGVEYLRYQDVPAAQQKVNDTLPIATEMLSFVNYLPYNNMIQTNELGKRYQKEWIFKGFSMQFEHGKAYAITGKNGSGKSTLMQVLSGFLSPTKGSISFGEMERDVVYQQVSFCAPYIELIEEFTLLEALDFHQKFKPFVNGFSTKQVIDMLELPLRSHRQALRFFSSGMRQRVKLALAILSKSAILLLDEPTITLDADACAWYQHLLRQHLQNRLIIIASNVAEDYECCNQVISIMDYK